MDILTNVEKAVRVWSFDGGGNGALSQLIIVDKLMRHIQWKQRLAKVPRPCDYADVMIGAGLGGAAAILMGRLGLTASETYEDIVQLGRDVFMKPNPSLAKPLFNLNTLKANLRSILKRRGYKSDVMMIGDDHLGQKCRVIVLASSTDNVTSFRSLRTYISPTSVNCTIVDAIVATMAVPDWFDPVTVRTGDEQQTLIGGSIGYNNPTWQGLLEAKQIFGNNASVTSVISIGSGKSALAASTTLIDSNIIIDEQTRSVKQIQADSEQTALRLSEYFRDIPAYNRFSVDNLNELGISDWTEGVTDLVKSLTTFYLDKIGKDLDQAIENLLLDVGSITLGRITQAATVPAGIRFSPPLTPYYVPRPEIHKIMDQCFNEDETEAQRLLVIQGMAGSGKTQSASFFARSHRNSSIASVKADLQSAVRSLGGSHSQETFEDALLYLKSIESGDWLVIFDNADDPSLPLIEFIPSCDHGHIIITTRNPDLALLAPTSHLSMPRMKDEEALRVLFLAAQSPGKISKTDQFAKIASEKDYQDAVEICRLVGSLPLVLVQVGCYCHSSKVSFSQYLERYKEHRWKLMNIQPAWQLDQYPHSAYTSISLSYSLLDERERSLFHLLAFFHPSSIHMDILRASAAHQFTADPDVQLVPRDDWHDQRLQKLRAIFEENGKWDQYRVDQLLMRLQTLSLVSLGSEDGSSIISIHPLVQSFAQDIMAQEEFDCFLYMAVVTLSGCVWDDNLFLFRHLLLHVSEVENQKVPLHLNDAASFAYVFYTMSLIREAFQRWNALRDRCYEQLGSEHPSTLSTTSDIAFCLSRLGEYEAASTEINSVILVQEKLLGRDHRDTCVSYEALAINLNKRGKLQEAEVIFRENIEILKSKYGNEHDYTLQNASMLCENLSEQAKYSEAENLLRDTIAVMRKVYDKDHNVLLATIRKFAEVLMKRGQWEEAEDLLQPLVQTYARIFGKEHTRTALPLFDLALCIRQKGELREAEKMQRIALELMEKDSGANHPRIVEIQESLEETIQMVYQKNGGISHNENENENELGTVVEYRGKVVFMILAVLAVLLSVSFSRIKSF